MRAKDKQAVAALRSALAAIDNAEAVAAPQPPLHAAPDSGAGTDEPPPSGGPSSGAGAEEIPIGAGSGSDADGAGTPIAGAVVGLAAGEVERRTLTGAGDGGARPP